MAEFLRIARLRSDLCNSYKKKNGVEEKNGIFLAGGHVLVYLAEPVHKKYSTTFVWGHPFSTYVSYDRLFNPLPWYTPVHILDEPPPFPPVAYVLN